jgi:hypothetical protein
MKDERETSEKWYWAWGVKLMASDGITDRVRLLKRVGWAHPRRERALRALLPEGPRCWYCERPGHDESEQACQHRTRAAKSWAMRGQIWNREEGA